MLRLSIRAFNSPTKNAVSLPRHTGGGREEATPVWMMYDVVPGLRLGFLTGRKAENEKGRGGGSCLNYADVGRYCCKNQPNQGPLAEHAATNNKVIISVAPQMLTVGEMVGVRLHTFKLGLSGHIL